MGAACSFLGAACGCPWVLVCCKLFREEVEEAEEVGRRSLGKNQSSHLGRQFLWRREYDVVVGALRVCF